MAALQIEQIYANKIFLKTHWYINQLSPPWQII